MGSFNQADMQAHDDLIALFSRNLTLHQPEPKPEPKSGPQIVYSISQHYHHSSHLARKQDQQQQSQPPPHQRPSSLPPPENGPSIEQVLTAHGIEPSSLSHAQMQLFKTADDAQKMRLLELWRICPPTPNNMHENPALAWNTTTVEQEEALAKARYERQQQEEQARKQQAEFEAQQNDCQKCQGNQIMSLDGTMVPFQGGDSRWISLADSSVQDVEPYMASGYEQLARKQYEMSASTSKKAYSPSDTSVGELNNIGPYKQATDPVYCQVMENQYGAFQMRRGTCGIFDEMEVV